MDTTMDRDTLGAKLLPELQQIAQGMGVEGAQKLRKAGLIDAIVAASTNGGDPKPTRHTVTVYADCSARLDGKLSFTIAAPQCEDLKLPLAPQRP